MVDIRLDPVHQWMNSDALFQPSDDARPQASQTPVRDALWTGVSLVAVGGAFWGGFLLTAKIVRIAAEIFAVTVPPALYTIAGVCGGATGIVCFAKIMKAIERYRYPDETHFS